MPSRSSSPQADSRTDQDGDGSPMSARGLAAVITVGVMVVLLAQVFLTPVADWTGIAGAWNPSWVPWRDLATNRTILRVTYFVLTGCLIGYLGEQEKELDWLAC